MDIGRYYVIRDKRRLSIVNALVIRELRIPLDGAVDLRVWFAYPFEYSVLSHLHSWIGWLFKNCINQKMIILYCIQL